MGRKPPCNSPVFKPTLEAKDDPCNVIFEWKIEKGGNSGFMWGVKEDSKYKYPYQTGPEIQIIDIAISVFFLTNDIAT